MCDIFIFGLAPLSPQIFLFQNTWTFVQYGLFLLSIVSKALVLWVTMERLPMEIRSNPVRLFMDYTQNPVISPNLNKKSGEWWRNWMPEMCERVIANLYAVSYTNKTHLFTKYISIIYLGSLGKEEPPSPKNV